MMLTAFAVVVGGLVILADPIFQGLAISLLFGAIASLVISPLAVPLIYYMTHAGRAPAAAAPDAKCDVSS
jgi:multidrug efflux pump subunit AcrB